MNEKEVRKGTGRKENGMKEWTGGRRKEEWRKEREKRQDERKGKEERGKGIQG